MRPGPARLSCYKPLGVLFQREARRHERGARGREERRWARGPLTPDRGRARLCPTPDTVPDSARRGASAASRDTMARSRTPRMIRDALTMTRRVSVHPFGVMRYFFPVAWRP